MREHHLIILFLTCEVIVYRQTDARCYVSILYFESLYIYNCVYVYNNNTQIFIILLLLDDMWNCLALVDNVLSSLNVMSVYCSSIDIT